MARKFIHGRGMTAREHTALESAADFRQWAKSWNAAIKEGGGIFGAVSLDAVEMCEQILADAMATDDASREDSPEAFAQAIARCIHGAKVEIKNGNADLAARNAWEAGVRLATATIKWRWEKHALRGERSVTAGAEGGRATNAPKRPEAEKRMARIADLLKVPDMTVSKAAARCAHELGGSAEYLRQKWYEHIKEKV
jgi:hypothetical protein